MLRLPGGRGITRRAILGTSAAAAAAAVGGGLLAGCSGQAASKGSSAAANGPLPTPQSGVTHILFQAPPGPPWNKTTIALSQEFTDQSFNQNPKNKGIWATVSPGGWGGGGTQIAADIAGSGFTDIWAMCCNDIPLLEASGFAQPLDPLLRRDNISQDNWSKGHILANSYAGQLYGLPSYDGTLVVIYRQDVLDRLGLAYPDPNWDYKAAAQIFEQCVGKNAKGQKRAGASLYWNGAYEMIDWWLRGWGAREMSDDQTKATMATPAGAECLTWSTDLFASGAAVNRGDVGLLASEQAVFLQRHAGVLEAATTLGDSVKWNILPNPIWPKGRTTFVTIDCYMLNQVSKDTNAAWEVLKWLALGTQQGDGTWDNGWAKFQIQISLITPALVNLWDYWIQTVKTVAPPLKNKDLKWYADSAQKGYCYPTIFYKYQAVQATNVVNNWCQQIFTKKVSPEIGLQQMQDQLNAMESAGAQELTAGASAEKLFPTTGPRMAGVQPGL